MLSNKFNRYGLHNFDYKKTAWYQAIRNEKRNYKYSLILVSLLALMLALAALALFALLERSYTPLPVFGAFFLIVAGLVFFLVKFRKVKFMTFLCLLTPGIGLLVSLYLPGCKDVYFFFAVTYPVLAIQMRGTRRGPWWVLSFAVFFAALYGAELAGLLPAFYARLSPFRVVELICVGGLVYAVSFLTERREESMIERLTDRFVFDEVTGLPDKDVLSHSILSDRKYLFAIIKIENFSNLVALFGYDFSDTVSQFASRKMMKYEDRFHYKTYQLKYNEYGILAERKNSESIAESAQFLNEVISALEIESLPWERDEIRLVYRVGGALIEPGDTQNPLSRADIALKRAERGHSVITIYENDSEEKETAYNYVMRFSELVSNRENKTFRAVFQPVFDSDGTHIVWYEALLRVLKQDGAYSSIFPYLAVAKSTGFYSYITEFILRESAKMIRQHDVDVSVNIAIHDIVRPDFIRLVDEIYDQIRGQRGRIIFEILESDEVVELDQCLWFIDYISRYGFRIAIDDFGTGYSNYCSLISLPIDIVKIDGSLIKKIRHDENAKILVEGIVNFCEKANKKTVAEYVENKEVFDSLREMKIDFLQGYYLAEPGSFPT